jgi:hypothetical protein
LLLVLEQQQERVAHVRGKWRAHGKARNLVKQVTEAGEEVIVQDKLGEGKHPLGHGPPLRS